MVDVNVASMLRKKKLQTRSIRIKIKHRQSQILLMLMFSLNPQVTAMTTTQKANLSSFSSYITCVITSSLTILILIELY